MIVDEEVIYLHAVFCFTLGRVKNEGKIHIVGGR